MRRLYTETLVGPVNLIGKLAHWTNDDGTGSWFSFVPGKQRRSLIHWVICGGESGPHARPMHPEWARSLRQQCGAAGVPFFFKQWGEWQPFTSLAEATEPNLKWGEDPRLRVIWPSGLTTSSAVLTKPSVAWDQGARAINRLGKRAAGRLLDGREWSEFPGRGVSA
jgi:hypothetical protein